MSTYTYTAYNAHGVVVSTARQNTPDDIRAIVETCATGMHLHPEARTICVLNSYGAFVMAVHRNGAETQDHLVSVAQDWWNVPQRCAETPATAYTARKAVDAWLEPILRERAALDRLEAALDRLT